MADIRIGTVMIVDDEVIDQRCATRILDRSGVVGNHVCFDYAEDALAFLRREDRPPVDVILLDINMPRLNGFEFLERAVAELGPAFARIVVVMLSTSIAAEDWARADAFDVVKDFFDKPLRGEHVRKLCTLLDGLDDSEAQDAVA